MKPITVALLLIASVPANYFAFDFASKNMDNIPEAYIPNLPDLSKLTSKNIQYCSSQETNNNSQNKSFQESSIMERQDQIMQKHNQAIDSADAQIQRQADDAMRQQREQIESKTHEGINTFFSTVREKVEKEWGNLMDTHGITKDSYSNCQTTIQIQLKPDGGFHSVGITEGSGNDKFDDIVFLSVFHTSFKEEFNQLPKNVAYRNYRQFNLRFTPNDVK